AKAIARAPEDRFPTADALRDALIEVAGALAVPLGAAALALPTDSAPRSSGVRALAETQQQLASTPPPAPTPTESPRAVPPPRRWRRRALMFAAATAIAVVTAAAGATLAHVTAGTSVPVRAATVAQRPTLPPIGSLGGPPSLPVAV